jgi:hypothetical protein
VSDVCNCGCGLEVESEAWWADERHRFVADPRNLRFFWDEGDLETPPQQPTVRMARGKEVRPQDYAFSSGSTREPDSSERKEKSQDADESQEADGGPMNHDAFTNHEEKTS